MKNSVQIIHCVVNNRLNDKSYRTESMSEMGFAQDEYIYIFF